MKKSLVYLSLAFLLMSCGGSQTKGDESATDSTGVAQDQYDNSSEGALYGNDGGQALEEEAPAPRVTAIEFTTKREVSVLGDPWYITITAHMNMDDGSATVKKYTKAVTKDTHEVMLEETDNYEGSWKAISVKRGNNYLDAYDIECDNVDDRLRDDHMEIYTTDRLDYAFCNKFSDDPYWEFHEGQTKLAGKITDKKEITEN